MKSIYVISVKRIKGILSGKLLSEGECEWNYLVKDNGPMGSGEDVFSSGLRGIIKFRSVEEAVEYWNKQHKGKNDYTNRLLHEDGFDESTFGVRKLVFKTMKKL